jgi:hypothetical protein
MKRSTVRLGLSLLVAMGWWVQRLPAQAPTAPEAPSPPARLSPAPVLASAPCCGGEAGPDQPGPPKTLLRQALNRHGVGCYTTHNVPGCGSLHSELTFIFGSCRVFFGEPCMARPPRVPAADYAH